MRIKTVEVSLEPVHSALKPMYFENAGHLGGDAENDIPKIQRISVTPPKFPMYFGDVILSIPAQMSLFEL